MGRELQALSEPLSAASPCGESLEDTQILAGFDAYRLFGRDELPEKTDWRAIRDQSLEALSKSRDLRVLAYLAAAVVRLEGLPSFFEVLAVADRWLAEHWDAVFPLVDDDALLRKNALNYFADRIGIIDPVRRAVIVAHRQLGSVCLRDVELATGQIAPTPADTAAPNSAQIEAIFAGTPAEQLSALAGQLAAAMTSVRGVVATMQTRGGFEYAPDFDPVLKALSRIEKLVAEHLPAERISAEPKHGNGADSGLSVIAVGEIKSRQDAIRAIDAIVAFFRKNEPSSPIPLLLERAKRLVSKSFMEVLEDIAPESLTHVKLIGGIKSDEG
jgi:type VI secretion system protein ImpA